MTTEEGFDILIIGAGPAAVAALNGLSYGQRIAVVTGAVPSAEKWSTLHPKIQAVSLATADVPGVAERIAARRRRSRPLFSTAAEGGLANYWGQQFVRLGEADPWPRDAFASFHDYERACGDVERLFEVNGGERVNTGLLDDGFEFVRPRIVVGSAADRSAGLNAMRFVFAEMVAESRARLIHARVKSLARVGGRWAATLDDGAQIVAARILLAAGVLGDGQILLRSFPDLGGLQFTDHTPWMLFTVGVKRRLFNVCPGAPSFNALTLRRNRSEGCELFASFYDMRASDLNLLLASTIGRAHPWLRRWPSPPGAGLVTPVQVWTRETYGRVEITPSEGEPTFISEEPAKGRVDEDLMDFVSRLNQLGCRVIRRTRTEPAFGYHYHRLRLRPRGGDWVEVADLLRDRTDGAVISIDAAQLDQIGRQPHTLTMMAGALACARTL